MQELTTSTLVQNTVKLSVNCANYSDVFNVAIFKRCSSFLRELSNDNQYIKDIDLTDLTTFLSTGFKVLPENIDFYWNLVEFHFNVVL